MFKGEKQGINNLRNKFYNYNNLKKAIFEFAFVKDIETNLWNIYYGRIIITNRNLNPDDEFVKPDDDVLVVRSLGSRENALNFLLQLQDKQNYFISTTNINKLDISSSFLYIEEPRLVHFQEGKQNNIEHPAEIITMKTEKNFPSKRLQNFVDLDSMIYELFKINLKKHEGFKNTLSFYFEKEDGKIYDVAKYGTGLCWKIKFNENEVNNYKVILFNRDSETGNRTEFKEVKKEMFCEAAKNFRKYEIRLLKDNKTIDFYYSNKDFLPEKSSPKELKVKEKPVLKESIIDEYAKKIPFLKNEKHKKYVAVGILIVVILFFVLTGLNNLFGIQERFFPPSTDSSENSNLIGENDVVLDFGKTPEEKDGKTSIRLRLINKSSLNLNGLGLWYKFDCYMDDYYKLPIDYRTLMFNEQKEYWVLSDLNYSCDAEPRFEDRIFIDEENNFYKIESGPIENVCCKCNLFVKIRGNNLESDLFFSDSYNYYPTTLPYPSFLEYRLYPNLDYNYLPFEEPVSTIPKTISTPQDINKEYKDWSPIKLTLPLFEQMCDRGEISEQDCIQYKDYWEPTCSAGAS